MRSSVGHAALQRQQEFELFTRLIQAAGDDVTHQRTGTPALATAPQDFLEHLKSLREQGFAHLGFFTEKH